ncbi:conjugal transfer protein TraF [Vibrio mediterranei]|uniref:conjugal transfer protein TraF n=1 Tax=Vibrio mediterranei TaxID=689 RepID=UPI00406848B9
MFIPKKISGIAFAMAMMSGSAIAAPYGVATKSGAEAALVNPALLSTQPGQFIEVIIPSVSVTINDEDHIQGMVDDIVELADAVRAGAGPVDGLLESDRLLTEKLDELGQSNMPVISGSGAFVVAANLPSTVKGALFLNGAVDATGAAYVDTINTGLDKYDNTTVDIIGRATIDLGLSMSYAAVANQHMFSLGVSPKIQSLRVYGDKLSLDDYSISDLADNYDSSSQFNLDVGAAYRYHDWNVGVVGKNLLKHEASIDLTKTYHVSAPQIWTVGFGYSNDYWTAFLDADLVERTVYKGAKGQQFVRLGAETDIFKVLTVKGRLDHDIASSTPGAGIGIGLGIMQHAYLEADVGLTTNGDPSAKVQVKFAL